MALSAINIVLNAVTDLFNRDVKAAADTMEKSSAKMQQSANKAGQAIEQSLGSGQLRQKIAAVTAEIDEQKQITREFMMELEKLRQKRDTMSKMDVQGQKRVRQEIEQTKAAIKDQSIAVSELTAKKQGFTQQLGITNQTLGGTRAALNGLATSFSSVSSIIAIVADDNKALRNTLMGLNAALNFSAAVMQVKDLQEQFGGLTKFLTNPWVLATIAIGATVAAVYAYSNSLSDAEKIQREVNDELEKATESAHANAITLNEYLSIVNDANVSEQTRLGALEQLKKLGVAIDGININNAASLAELNKRVEQNINLSIQKAIADKAAAKIAEIEFDRIQKLNEIRREGGSLLGQMREKFLPGYIASVNESNAVNDEAAAKTKLYADAFKNAALEVAKYTDIETAARKESAKVSQQNAKEKEKEAESILKSAESVKKAQQSLIDYLEKKRFEGGEKAKKKAAEDLKQLTGANLIAGTAVAPVLVQVKIDPKSYSQIVQDFDNLMVQMAAAVEKLGEDMAVTLGETLGNALAGQGNGIEGFVRSVVGQLGNFVKTVGKMLIAYGISVEKFKTAFVQPEAAVVAGIAMVALGTAVASQMRTGPSVSAFADGGIVSGPTLGLMGEYPGARSNPEVIAPLDKLKTLMKPEQSSGYVAQTHISGRDLAIVLERYNKDSRRG
jgi:hypothetical protein